MVIHLVIDCSSCDAQIRDLYWRSQDGAEDLIARARKEGWQMKGQYDPAICPTCVRLNAEETAEPATQEML
jgi:hypothetical protein